MNEMRNSTILAFKLYYLITNLVSSLGIYSGKLPDQFKFMVDEVNIALHTLSIYPTLSLSHSLSLSLILSIYISHSLSLSLSLSLYQKYKL